MSVPPSTRLSVSSTGSISLQPRIGDSNTTAWPIFQYPQPDRYPCNYLHLASVSVGMGQHFQYPQPDRYPCNRTSTENAPPSPSSLSVSSTGSISLQPEHSRHVVANQTQAFSILNRIDIPATFPVLRR